MDIIIDSDMTVTEATADHHERPAPQQIRDMLQLLTIKYWSYDKKIHQGQLVVSKIIAEQVTSVFAQMLGEQIPIAKMIPISAYDWDDEQSMQDNACSGYNFRQIAGKPTLSLHALGLAIDVDPLFNPWMKGDEVQPAGAYYDLTRPGTLTSESRTVQIFKSHGFYWGGDWLASRGYVDYQHFDINPHVDSETIIHELRERGLIPS
jgi:hypothetical protein